jgi:aldose 1-epimerase
MTNATGDQYDLEFEGTRAAVTQVAAALRGLVVDGHDLVEPYPSSVVPPMGSGTVLVPWPNRVRDGVWHYDGAEQLLDITEPELHNSLHGLLRDRPYDLREQTKSSVTLAATIFPTRGYPFTLITAVKYELAADGIMVTHTFTNDSATAVPVAVGVHPYLRVGDVPIDELIVTVPAGTRFETDDRLNPIAENRVDGTRFDLRGGVSVAGLALDDAFGELEGDRSSRLTAPDGSYTELWQDPDFRWAQVFVTRIFPRGGVLGSAIAVEPMSAPPNALNSGVGLRWLAPGESWNLSWGIRYSGARG